MRFPNVAQVKCGRENKELEMTLNQGNSNGDNGHAQSLLNRMTWSKAYVGMSNRDQALRTINRLARCRQS